MDSLLKRPRLLPRCEAATLTNEGSRYPVRSACRTMEAIDANDALPNLTAQPRGTCRRTAGIQARASSASL